jgi:hypothetical protein
VRWLKRDMLKAGIALAGLLLLLILMVWVPVSASAYIGASGLALAGPVQATPTIDATVTELNKEKLEQEVQQLRYQNEQLKNQNAPDFFVWLPAWLRTNAAVLVVVIGGLIGLFRWFGDRRSNREKQAEERFQSAVTGLGDEQEGAKIGAAIVLRTFLRRGYKRFYIQTFDLAVAHLRLPRSPHQPEDPEVPLPLTTLSHALIAVFKEAFSLARRRYIATEEVWSYLPFPFKQMYKLYYKQTLVYIFLFRNSVWNLGLKETFRTAINQFMINKDINFQSLDANDVQLDNAYLRLADLKQVWMPQASLRKADLSEAQLHRANLSGADLGQACLRGTNLFSADLREAKLHEANLDGADLSYANLGEADLSRANIENARSLEKTNLRRVTGLTEQQLVACKAKGAIIDEDSITDSSQPTAASPAPAQSNDSQAAAAPLAQVNTPPTDLVIRN